MPQELKGEFLELPRRSRMLALKHGIKLDGRGSRAGGSAKAS